MLRVCFAAFGLLFSAGALFAQIPKPDDAPQPMTPAKSMEQVQLPPGFHLQLVACEPLIQEVTGICFDERGRAIVCEMHGYNLEGQYDVEELNKIGKLDTIPRVIYASPEAKKKAAAGTYGTIKLLIDTNGDGQMDKAEVWADHIPACQGICAARGGVIIVCAPDIIYLADRDGDGKAETRETLYTGLPVGPLERGANCPMWNLDNWIYIGHGHDGGKITGPHMQGTYALPSSDFRIKADGTAIEAVSGKTRTIGHSFTEWGHRIIISTPTAAIMVAPLPWNYLARNRELITPNLEKDLNTDSRCYPISQAHPWRTKRHELKAWSSKGGIYGAGETTPNGFYTSLCSPLLYRDDALPGLKGQDLACEPAQNFVHRAIIARDGRGGLKMTRAPGEEHSEFLASKDAWFHPIYLTHGYDGSVYLIDFYREIIEDYAAVPRHLQQIYGDVNGHDMGRIYKLVHDNMPQAPPADMSKLSPEQLAQEVASPYYWRRETARRLLIERGDKSNVKKLAAIIQESADIFAVINALYTLDGLAALSQQELLSGLKHQDPAVRVQTLRIADSKFSSMPGLVDAALSLARDEDPNVLIQLGLSLGESNDPRAFAALLDLAKAHGDLEFMPTAILSSAGERSVEMLTTLLSAQEKNELGQARQLLEPLCAVIGARMKANEIAATLDLLVAIGDTKIKESCARSLRGQFKRVANLGLEHSAREACEKLQQHTSRGTAQIAAELIVLLHLETADERTARLAKAAGFITDVKLPIKRRLGAIREMAAENDPAAILSMLSIFNASSPQIRELILETIFARSDNMPAVVDALESGQLPPALLTGLQRDEILSNPKLKARAEKVFKSLELSDEITKQYLAALDDKADLARGEKVFRDHCSGCHNVRGIGYSIGPNLTAEFQRAKEAFLKDILSPSAVISQGYTTYQVVDDDGIVVSGLLTEYSASYTFRQAAGKTVHVLRKNVSEPPRALTTSLMPDNFYKLLSPRDVADLIEWIRTPVTNIMLVDNNIEFLQNLTEGPGKAEFVSAGDDPRELALRIIPPEKSKTKISGWEFKIRENPAPGEFRYIRYAWKSDGAKGIILELANNATWPKVNDPSFRYCVGEIGTRLRATKVAEDLPKEWSIVTRDLWKDFGDSSITGISVVAIDGPVLLDKVELLQTAE